MMYSLETLDEEGLKAWERENALHLKPGMPTPGIFTGVGENITLFPVRSAEKIASPFLGEDYVSSRPEASGQGMVAHVVESLSDIAPWVAGTTAMSYGLRLIPTPATQALGWGTMFLSQVAKHSSKIAGATGALYAMWSKHDEAKRDYVQEGIDESTAEKLAMTEAITTTTAMVAPGGFASKSMVKSLSGGLALPVAIGMADRGIKANILKENGYPEMSEQYEILDKHAILADVLMYSLIASAHSPTIRKSVYSAGEETIGRALYMGRSAVSSGQDALKSAIGAYKEFFHFSRDSHPGIPTTPKSWRAHQDVMEEVMDNIIKGEKIQFDEQKLSTISEQSLPNPQRQSLVKDPEAEVKYRKARSEKEPQAIPLEKESERKMGEGISAEPVVENEFSAVDTHAGNRLNELEKTDPKLAQEVREMVKEDLEFAHLVKEKKLQSVLVDCFIKTGGIS